MKRTIFLIAIAGFALPTSAQTLSIDSIAMDSLHVAGRYCKFGAQRDTVLISDWNKKFWMRIDGKTVEFEGQKKDVEVESQLKNKRWHEVLKADEVTVYIDLVETGRGDDSASFRGTVDVQRGSVRKHFLVAGGCGA
ncbi:hypothetical protein [Rugamonas aquatica]|uniref:Uncharacterized protein n=1 Tax=Rugamonas aquatica TaxID=2743357 RepID=A0A6A7N5P6_9BURK|nr:hypothetical protein [Rugamonas aquatica]MQA40360.1 hypothetical protein [Rugamonas aquatica]